MEQTASMRKMLHVAVGSSCRIRFRRFEINGRSNRNSVKLRSVEMISRVAPLSGPFAADAILTTLSAYAPTIAIWNPFARERSKGGFCA